MKMIKNIRKLEAVYDLHEDNVKNTYVKSMCLKRADALENTISDDMITYITKIVANTEVNRRFLNQVTVFTNACICLGRVIDIATYGEVKSCKPIKNELQDAVRVVTNNIAVFAECELYHLRASLRVSIDKSYERIVEILQVIRETLLAENANLVPVLSANLPKLQVELNFLDENVASLKEFKETCSFHKAGK